MVALPTPFDHSAYSSDSPFKQMADKYVAAGYAIVPVLPHNKAPGQYADDRWKLMDAWPSMAEKQRTNPSIIGHWKSWPDANIGIILGTEVGGYQVIAVDVDTSDEDEQDRILSQLPVSRMRKQGERGFTLFYRASLEVRTRRYTVPAPTPERPANKRTVLELLTGNAPKQTVMPPSIHPSGLEYQWYSRVALVPAAELPVLTDDDLEQLEDTLGHMGWDPAADTTVPAGSTRVARDPDDEDNIWRETNNAALANLDAWCGFLGLAKLRKVGARWEAVAEWRPSQTGRSLHERKPNLSLHPSGIKDMGTQETYSAADVVMRALSYSAEEAFSFLRDKLGLKDDDSVFKLPMPVAPTYVSVAEDGTLYDQATGEVVHPAPAFEIESVTVEECLAPRVKLGMHSGGLEMPDHLTRPLGLLGDLTDYIEKTANTPNRVIAFGSALTALSTITGRKFASPTYCGTALYVLCVGKTGCGKQHGINMLLKSLRAAKAEMTIGSPEAMSMTALIAQLKDKPLSASGVDEFGQYLKRINSKRGGPHDEGIKKVMLSAWGANFADFQTPQWANSPSKTIHAPHFSMLGMTTPHSFYNALEASDIDNGLLNRFLLLQTEVVNPQQFENLALPMPDALMNGLCGLFLFEEGHSGDARRHSFEAEPEIKALGWGRGALECYQSFVSKMNARCNDATGGNDAFYARTAEMGLRIATIQALARNVSEMCISIDDMEYGANVAEWSASSMSKQARAFMAETPHQAEANRIVDIVKKNGGKIEQSALSRRLRNRLPAKQVKDILASICETGVLKQVVSTPVGGGARKTEYILQKAVDV